MTPAAVTVRRATAADGEALLQALLCAVNWDPERPALGRDAVLADPALAHYVTGWPWADDLGVVATTGPDGAARPVGAAWLRHLSPPDAGYGWVAPGVPEISIGVQADRRGQGIGRRLLRELLHAARDAGIGRVSLSVERANRARRLYLSEGFVAVSVSGAADTMVADLSG